MLVLSEPKGVMSWYDATSTKWEDGWRIPSRAELLEIIDSSKVIRDYAWTWTSVSSNLIDDDAWTVVMVSGCCAEDNKNSLNSVRLVKEV